MVCDKQMSLRDTKELISLCGDINIELYTYSKKGTQHIVNACSNFVKFQLIVGLFLCTMVPFL